MGKQKLFTVRQLEPGHLEEDCPITTISEKKRLSSFSATDQLNSRPSTMQPLKSLKAGVLTNLASQETVLKYMNVIVSLA